MSEVKCCFILLVGAPASGKSTWADTYKYSAVVVSSDAIRKELYGDESIQGNPEEVFNLAHRRILEALKENKSVIFDATNIKYKNRMAIMREVNKLEGVYKDCEIFAEPLEVLLERNNARDRKVPEEVIRRMISQFEMPTYAEGYDSIHLTNKNKINVHEVLNKAVEFDQKNSHHSLSLYEHCNTAERYIIDNRVHGYTRLHNLMCDAALFHDLGKLETQTFFDKRGNPSEDAHYYGHEHVSAYWALMYSYAWKEEDRIYAAQLICYHMIPYFVKTEEAERRWRERIGSKVWDDVLVLHEADRAAK